MTYLDKRIAFEVNKVRRLIKTNGEQFTFSIAGVNEFGEPDEDKSEVLCLNGIWHTSNTYVSKSSTEATQIAKKQQPQLLCLDKDVVEHLKAGAKLSYGGKPYEVLGIVDINNWGAIYDISLEVIDNEE